MILDQLKEKVKNKEKQENTEEKKTPTGENNIRLNFNTNNRSSFSKRVEYSNTKARKKIKSKFNKKIGEEEKKIELSTDSMSSIEKMKLIQIAKILKKVRV